MAAHIRNRTTERKSRLFAVACCRLVWDGFVDERSREAVEVAEQFADGLVSDYRRMLAEARARDVEKGPDRGRFGSDQYFPAIAAKMAVLARINLAGVGHFALAFRPGRERLATAGAGLLREVVGNPFRPVALDHSWLTSTVVALARSVYDDRAFDRLPILADALQDAGCANDHVLDHCRSDGPHVRGCWVVDLVLGKV
jgi:hypothetical protein